MKRSNHLDEQMSSLLSYLRPHINALESHAGLWGMATVASSSHGSAFASSPHVATIGSSTISNAWLADNEVTPAVRFMPGTEPPTALSWMRRRGPAVHHGILFKLFRAREVSALRSKEGPGGRVSTDERSGQGSQCLGMEGSDRISMNPALSDCLPMAYIFGRGSSSPNGSLSPTYLTIVVSPPDPTVRPKEGHGLPGAPWPGAAGGRRDPLPKIHPPH